MDLSLAADLAGLLTLLQVVLIDVALAGDNAIVVGLAASALPPAQRGRAILIGIGVATVLRVALALVAARLLVVIGLTLAGGLLLLWVAWKMAREALHAAKPTEGGEPKPAGSLRQALLRIVLADVSMSLDNVLAVAGTARAHPWVLAAGLVLSVALMGVASQLVTRLLGRLPWLVWLGLGIVAYVALKMIWQGWHEVQPIIPAFW